ncbi:hypothetical protein [Streptosporangium sp. NPDC050280]
MPPSPWRTGRERRAMTRAGASPHRPNFAAREVPETSGPEES